MPSPRVLNQSARFTPTKRALGCQAVRVNGHSYSLLQAHSQQPTADPPVPACTSHEPIAHSAGLIGRSCSRAARTPNRSASLSMRFTRTIRALGRQAVRVTGRSCSRLWSLQPTARSTQPSHQSPHASCTNQSRTRPQSCPGDRSFL